ncbi:hypothetical protein CCUS01_06835 [Colletotrichum cuscutae]|uniref:Uncharacterized protein n=1 Tax=Colletotrichum cuscutae TaxID=1209917 RepID=A0AAI9XYK6_9PEZI|nr:hypothetical protein CCUS01_06835 [Colletotrichum cuscutae]
MIWQHWLVGHPAGQALLVSIQTAQQLHQRSGVPSINAAPHPSYNGASGDVALSPDVSQRTTCHRLPRADLAIARRRITQKISFLHVLSRKSVRLAVSAGYRPPPEAAVKAPIALHTKNLSSLRKIPYPTWTASTMAYCEDGDAWQYLKVWKALLINITKK